MLVEFGRSQISHELLVNLMAKVIAIVNARPLTTVPSDEDEPQPLSLAMLLTMKTRPLAPPPGVFGHVDLYLRRRWRRVQYLADHFWVRRRREYLQSPQARCKWNRPQRDLITHDVVLVKQDGSHRGDWPLGRVTEAFKSDDSKVRKALVGVWRDSRNKTFLRPIKELVLLVPTQPSTDHSNTDCSEQRPEEQYHR